MCNFDTRDPKNYVSLFKIAKIQNITDIFHIHNRTKNSTKKKKIVDFDWFKFWSKHVQRHSFTQVCKKNCLSLNAEFVNRCACTCQNRTFRAKHTNIYTLYGAKWCIMIPHGAVSIKGNLIQCLLPPPPNSFSWSLIFKYFNRVWHQVLRRKSLKHVCKFLPHPSATLGSTFLDSSSSTQRAILSSLADEVQLAMSTVQWSAHKNTTLRVTFTQNSYLICN